MIKITQNINRLSFSSEKRDATRQPYNFTRTCMTSSTKTGICIDQDKNPIDRSKYNLFSKRNVRSLVNLPDYQVILD